MSNYRELNLEAGMPSVAEALETLERCIRQAKKEKIGCLLVIHGYGSTGKGGAINAAARRRLNAQKQNANLKSVIFGEDFDLFNFKALELKNKYPELAPLLKVCNHGVTVVEL